MAPAYQMVVPSLRVCRVRCCSAPCARVEAARNRQIARQGQPNARLAPADIDAHATPDAAGAALLKRAMAQLGFQRAAITASSSWRARWRTWRTRNGSAPRTSPSPCNTGARWRGWETVVCPLLFGAPLNGSVLDERQHTVALQP